MICPNVHVYLSNLDACLEELGCFDEMDRTVRVTHELEVVRQQMGTIPMLVGQMDLEKRECVRSREIATDLLGMMAATQKQDALVRAAHEGKHPLVEELLAAGVHRSAKGSETLEEHGLWQTTALIACARNGHVPVLALLLRASANVDKVGLLGERPLHAAAGNGQAACVERLLRAGADVNAQHNDGKTVLLRAIVDDNESIVKMLLDAGALRTHCRTVQMMTRRRCRSPNKKGTRTLLRYYKSDAATLRHLL